MKRYTILPLLMLLFSASTAFAQELPPQIWGSKEEILARLELESESASPEQTESQNKNGIFNNLVLEVSCVLSTFANSGPFDDDGRPLKAGGFVVQGFIYPEGTYEAMGTNSGVTETGEPEFPDLVIGSWICRGTYLKNLSDPTPTPVSLTIQDFDLTLSDPGAKQIITEGFELFFTQRAVIGGTGIYRFARGQVNQTIVGFNASGAPNFSMDFPAIGVIPFKNDK